MRLLCVVGVLLSQTVSGTANAATIVGSGHPIHAEHLLSPGQILKTFVQLSTPNNSPEAYTVGYRLGSTTGDDQFQFLNV